MKLAEPRVRRTVATLAEEWLDCLPSLTFHRRGVAWGPWPELPTVYILSNAADDILYVGQSQHLGARMKQHEHNSRLGKLDWDRAWFFTPGIPSHHLRLAAETVLIALTTPPGNQAILLKLAANQTLVEIRWRKK